MMRIRTMAGAAVVGAAAVAAIAGGVAYATADESEPTLRIVTEREVPVENAAQPDREDCPDKGAGSAEGAGL
jgi:hypothetical protein